MSAAAALVSDVPGPGRRALAGREMPGRELLATMEPGRNRLLALILRQ